MKRKFNISTFNLLIVGALLLSACSGGLFSQPEPASLIIPPEQILPTDFTTHVDQSTGIWGWNVNPTDDANWLIFKNVAYKKYAVFISADGQWVKHNIPPRPIGAVSEFGEASPEEFGFAAKKSLQARGMDPNLVTIGEDFVIVPRLGIPVDLYLKQYGNEAKARAIVDAAIEARIQICRLGACDLRDFKWANDVIDPRTGIVTPVDWGLVSVDYEAENRGYFKFPDVSSVQSENDLIRSMRGSYTIDLNVYLESLRNPPPNDIAPVPSPMVTAPDHPKSMANNRFKLGDEMIPGTGWRVVDQCYGFWCPFEVDPYSGSWYYNPSLNRVGFLPGYTSGTFGHIESVMRNQFELMGLNPNSVELNLMQQPAAGTRARIISIPYLGNNVDVIDLDTLYLTNLIDDATYAKYKWEGRNTIVGLYVDKNIQLDVVNHPPRFWVHKSSGKVFVYDFSGSSALKQKPALIDGTDSFTLHVDEFIRSQLSIIFGKTVDEIPVPPYPNVTLDSPHPPAATLVPPVINAPQQPSEPLIKKEVVSAVDGQIYPIELTQTEWDQVFRGNGDLLIAKGLPLGRLDKAVKVIGKIAGTTFVVLGVGFSAYVVIETIAQNMGLTDIYQVGWLEFPPYVELIDQDFSASAEQFREQLAMQGFEMTAAFYRYKDLRTMQQRYDDITPGKCQNLFLNDPRVTGVPGILNDLDVATPIAVCSDGHQQLLFLNLITQERTLWTYQEVTLGQWEWVITEGNPYQRFYADVETLDNKVVSIEFEVNMSPIQVMLEPTYIHQ